MATTIQRLVTIQNKKGLHARAAAKFVKTASAFTSEVTVTRLPQSPKVQAEPDWTVSARSILGLMMLGAEPGTQLSLEADGEDAEAALEALVALVDGRFEEGE